ncbi:MAG: hypothetical protein C4545_04045 [Anaerolineaceae bacterium]|jgi:hypothetical protein|nr:MAG: hypothetical protein C4545_04045 [Anaerolineaceae bacterium]
MSIINALKTYIATYSGLKINAPVWVDYLGADPTEYTIIPLAGGRIVESYIDDSSLREYPFAFQSMESTADELERLETQGFYEAFADWLESQTENGDLPELEAGQNAEKIEATGWAYLYQQGDSQTGIYQIQCRLTYTQE